MHLLIVSFFAGILTAAAPCILPLLPIIIGGTLLDEKKSGRWYKPLVVVTSLAISVVVFSLLLKATTAFLGIPQFIWNAISGVIVLALGLSMLFPHIWETVALKTGLYLKSNELMQFSSKKHGVTRDILIGASLGPVFSSCSPTYALIVAVILPQSFAKGFIYLIAYAIGLATILLLIALAGRSITGRMGWLSNPSGNFKKVVGVLFLIVGLAVITGSDRKLQTYVLDQGWYDPIMKLEQKLD